MPDVLEFIESYHPGTRQPEHRRGRWIALPLAFILTGCLLEAQTKPAADQAARDAFHKWYYNHPTETWTGLKWLGVPVQKNPFDLLIFQELIHENRPDVVIETGTAFGGSAWFFATVFDLENRGRIYTVDIENVAGRPQHRRITYLLGSSTSPDIVQKIRNAIRPGEKVMVTLDSDHRKVHVANELKIYAELVSVGQYLVVEDTNINGHPVHPTFGPGPWEAVEEFLKTDKRFEVDASKERLGFTFSPRGWLKRVR